MLGLLVSLMPSSFSHADEPEPSNTFMVSVVFQDGSYIFEPFLVPYDEGDSVRDALEATDLGFVFSGDGMLDSVAGYEPTNGVFMYTFTDYESHESVVLGDVPASSITSLFISAADVGALGEGHLSLLDQLRILALREDGTCNHPDVVQAYTRAIEGLPSAGIAQAQGIADALAQGIANYDEIMAGQKYPVTFRVTKDEARVIDASVTMTDPYGNVTVAEHTANGVYRAEVVALRYTYKVFDANGLDEVRCTRLDVASAYDVVVELPSDEWFDTISLRVGSGDAAACAYTCPTNNTSARNRLTETFTVSVPDAVKPYNDLFVYAEMSSTVAANKTKYPLYAVYHGVDGTDRESRIAYESKTFSPQYLIDEGAEGADFCFEIRHAVDTGSTVYQVETCRATIVRTPTLSGLGVFEGGTQILADFDPYTDSYDVYASADSVAILPTAFGSAADGYALQVQGVTVDDGAAAQVDLPDTAYETPVQVPVAVSLSGVRSTEYAIVLHKVHAAQITLNHEAGVTVELINSAGSIVPASASTDTSDAFDVLDGERYDYVATKDAWYHTSATIEASSGLAITVPTPSTDDALTGFMMGRTNTWTETTQYAHDDEASTLHDQYFFVPDYLSAQIWLRALPSDPAAAALQNHAYKATYTRQDTGKENVVDFSPVISGGEVTRVSGGMQGFTTASGYPNALTYTVTTGVDEATGATFYQDYKVTARRVLTLSGLAVSDGSSNLSLLRSETEDTDNPVYGFARDVRDYTVQVAGGTREVAIQFSFSRPVSSSTLSQGGYTVSIGEQTWDYAPGATMSATVPLDTSMHEQVIPLTVSHVAEETPDAAYRITVRQMPLVTVAFNTDPVDASVVVIDDVFGGRVYPNEDGTFSLVSGFEYDYTVSAYGYVGTSGQLLAYDGLVTPVKLEAAPDNPTIDPTIPSGWPYFRYDEDNNGVISAKTPTSADETLLYWATRLGVGYDSGAVGCPILVDGYLYTYAGDRIYKVDTVTGETVATGTMIGTSSFAITPMTYAEGMVFVALSNGRVEAFNAATLESLWVYTSPNGGQPNCPIAYHDGRIYTGFWNWTNVCDFVCLSVTDEDPTTPGSAVVDDPANPGQVITIVQDAKVPLWTCPHAGGFYWAGAWAGDDYVIVGSDDAGISAGLSVDDEGKASGTLMSIDVTTGRIIDTITEYPGGVNIGNIRSTVMRDAESGRFYYCGRGGYLCSVAVNTDGTFDHGSVQAIRLQNNATDGAISATSTPVIYNGRAYVGADHGAYNAYDGQSINVVDLATGTVAYVVNMQGRAQTSGLLTTGYVDDDGYVYVYYIDNYTPGKVRYFKDKPGQTSAEPSGVEEVDSGTAWGDMASVLFCPKGAQAQYCICSPIADEYGTIYFKNDSAYMMAIGPTIESLEVVKQPDVTVYGVGESFDATGMQVIAHYTNGASRDVSAYVSTSDEAFEQIGEVDVPVVFTHTMYQSNGTSGQDIGSAPDYNYAKPATSVKVTVQGEVSPTITTQEMDVAQATDTASQTEYPYQMQFTASGAPRTFTWTMTGALPEGLAFDAQTGTLEGTPAAGTGGEYPIAVSVDNGIGEPASREYTLKVTQRPAITTTASALPDATLGQEYATTVTASGYPDEFTFATQDGYEHKTQGWVSHTPEGLAIDAQTGELAGVPEESGEFHVRVYAANAVGMSIPRNYTLTVLGVPAIDEALLPRGVIGTAYSATVTAVGTPQPTFSWAAAEGSSLPEGLSLDTATGAISGTPTQAGEFQVVVTATNSQGSDSRTFTLAIAAAVEAPSIDTDELPAAALSSAYAADLAIGGAPSPTVTVTGLPVGLVFDPATVRLTGSPTHEGTYTVHITATNDGGTAQKDLVLVVSNPAVITTEVLGTPIDGEEGAGFILRGQDVELAIAASGSPAPTITVTGLPDGLDFDAAAGAIVGRLDAVDLAGTAITVRASNGVGDDALRTYALYVYEAPSVGTEELPSAELGEGYTATLDVSGVPAPAVIVTGLPNGIRYNAETGALEGTPSMSGAFSVSVTATNDAGSVKATLRLTVAAPVVIGADELPAARIGAAYSASLGISGYPAPAVTVEGLPDGLRFDEATGAIKGTPSTLGTYEVFVHAENSAGSAADRTFTLAVNDPLVIVTEALPTAYVGESYSAALEFEGEPASVQVEGLPQGIAFNASTHTFAGTPTQQDIGEHSISVTATASTGQVVSKTILLEIAPAASPVSMAAEAWLFPAKAGASVSYDLTDELSATGRPASFTWSLTQGAKLPEGIALGADGTLSGMPAVGASGEHAFDVICTNGIGEPARATVHLTVNEPVYAQDATLPSCTVGDAYQAQLPIGGYPAPVVMWEASDGSTLPPGLSLDSGTGVVHGTPTQAGTYTMTVRASNGMGEAATATVTLEILPGLPVKTDGTKYRIVSASDPRFILDVAEVIPTIGANVSIWTSNGGENQLFTFEVSDDGYVIPRNVANPELVLDAAGATPKVGANVSTWSFNNGMNQKWALIPSTDMPGFYSIASASDENFVLDAAGAVPEIGANVSIWYANGGMNQLWTFVEANDLAYAEVTAIGMSRNCTGSALSPDISVSLNGIELAEGEDYEVYFGSGLAAPAEPGCYAVMVKGVGDYSGTIELGDFCIFDVPEAVAGTKYHLASGFSDDFVLDVAEVMPTIGANVSIWVDNGGDNQLFTMELLDDGFYALRNVANPELVLDAAGAEPSVGANVSTWSLNGGMNQKWVLLPSDEMPGYYRIASASNTYYVLDAAGAAPEIGANVSIWYDNGGLNQLWKLVAKE